MKRKIVAIVGIIGLIGMTAVPVLAYGPRGGGAGYGQGNRGGAPANCPNYGKGYAARAANLTDEQRAELDKLHQKFIDETSQTRIDLWAKRGQMRTLMNTSNPDEAQVMALHKEIQDLKGKMAETRIKYQLEARKISPDARLGWGHGQRGYGRHMKGGPGYGLNCPNRDGKGYGRGMGQGSMRGGYGPGTCWN